MSVVEYTAIANTHTHPTPHVVQLVDGNSTLYYTYVSVPCVRLALFGEGRVTNNRGSKQCSNPEAAVAGTVCCSGADRISGDYGDICLYLAEPMRYDTAKARCSKFGYEQCSAHPGLWPEHLNVMRSCAFGQYAWRSDLCSLKLQVVLV